MDGRRGFCISRARQRRVRAPSTNRETEKGESCASQRKRERRKKNGGELDSEEESGVPRDEKKGEAQGWRLMLEIESFERTYRGISVLNRRVHNAQSFSTDAFLIRVSLD